MESYRLVAQDTISIKLEDEDSEIDAVPVKTDIVAQDEFYQNAILFLPII